MVLQPELTFSARSLRPLFKSHNLTYTIYISTKTKVRQTIRDKKVFMVWIELSGIKMGVGGKYMITWIGILDLPGSGYNIIKNVLKVADDKIITIKKIWLIEEWKMHRMSYYLHWRMKFTCGVNWKKMRELNINRH